MALFISANFDESGTHGSPYTVLGGYVASAAQWAMFEFDWRDLLATYGAPSFHAKEFHARSGNFRGWEKERQTQFVKQAESLLRANTLFSVVAAVVNQDHDEFRKSVGIKHYQHSHYGLAFQFCAVNTVGLVRRLWRGEEVSFVLEDGAKNAGDALRIYTAMRAGVLNKAGKRPPFADELGPLSFARNLPSLEAADFLVHRAYRDLMNGEYRTPSKTKHDARALLDATYLKRQRAALEKTAEDMKAYSASRLERSRAKS